jgi:hypothetical protein
MPSARLPFLVALGLGLAAVPATSRADDPAPNKPLAPKLNFAQQFVEGLRLGAPIEADPLVLFPLEMDAAPAALPVVLHTDAVGARISEPVFPARQFDVEAANSGDRPVLLLGGTLLVGGSRDRLISQDVIVPPGVAVDVRAHPAAPASEARRPAQPFATLPMTAPPYLRRRALQGASIGLVPTFASHFLEFRAPTLESKALAAVAASPLLQRYCEACFAAAAGVLKLKAHGVVVGFIVVVEGRPQAVEIFGSPALLQEGFGPILRGASFASAAIRLRAEKVGIKLPEEGLKFDEMAKDVDQLLGRLKKATYRLDPDVRAEGQALYVRTSDDSSGRAVSEGGRLVHMTVFPHDSFQSAIFGGPVLPEFDEYDRDDEYAPGYDELARRAATGRRLTPYEQRLLDRMRNRRGPGFLGPTQGPSTAPTPPSTSPTPPSTTPQGPR